MKTVVIYHANCADGFAAAWAAWMSLGVEATYIPAQYGDGPPMGDIEPGCRLFIVDFSYDAETLIGLAQQCNRVVVLDHHKTAQAALSGLTFTGLSITFDMDKSGAMLAWEHFHPGEPAPRIVEHVQDRDLWLWKLPDSREFSAALSVVPKDFRRWSNLEAALRSDIGRAGFINEGTAILAAQRQHVESLASKAFMTNVGGYAVPAVNSPIFQSEIGEELCKRYPEAPFAAVFFCEGPARKVWSLRSKNGFDVSVVAKALGGGGHAAAAGFKTEG